MKELFLTSKCFQGNKHKYLFKKEALFANLM